jgi:Protein of unknown function (DUF4235)
MNKLFAPISIVTGVLAGLVARKIFAFVWSKVDDEDAPDPKFREMDWAKLLIALLVEGAIARLVRGLADHGTRQAWMRTIGAWPGDERPQPE